MHFVPCVVYGGVRNTGSHIRCLMPSQAKCLHSAFITDFHMCTFSTPVSKYGASIRSLQRDLHMHKCIHFHRSTCQLAAVHISHTAVAAAPRGAGSCRVRTFFLLRGFIFHSPVGSKTPPVGTYTYRKMVRDGQRGTSGRGGGKLNGPRRSYTIRAAKSPGRVSRKLSRRVGIRGSFSCGRIWGNSGSESFHLKELTGLSCPPARTTATLLLPLVTGEVVPHR